jgi:DNA polymerase I-like protein with 3'-5' exonuclease and polymerase domains
VATSTALKGLSKLVNRGQQFIVPMMDDPLDSSIVLFDSMEWDAQILALKNAKQIGVDIETYTTDPYEPEGSLYPYLNKGEIRLIQVSLPKDKTLIFDLGGLTDDRAAIQKRLQRDLNVLFEKLADSDTTIVGQNLSFDYGWIRYKFGVGMRKTRDTMILSQIYWGGLRYGLMRQLKEAGIDARSPHTLSAIAYRMGLGVVEKSGLQDSDWGVALTNRQLNYAAKDSRLVLDIFKRLGNLCKEEGLKNTCLAELTALPAFGEMMFNGMPVCLETLGTVLSEYKEAAENAIAPFVETFPGVNQNSPKQLVAALNKKFGKKFDRPLRESDLEEEDDRDCIYREWENIEKSNDEALLPYAHYPEIGGLLLYRGLMTQVKYLENIQSKTVNGRVHSRFTQIAPQALGRSSCSSPNLQNPSNLKPQWKKLGLKSVRVVFRAPEGKELGLVDLAKAHAQIARHASKDPVMTDADLNGVDSHSLTAEKFLAKSGKPWSWQQIAEWKEDKDHPNHSEANSARQLGKTGFYSFLNLASAFRVMVMAKTSDNPIDAPIETFETLMEALKETYSGLVNYQWGQVKEAGSKCFKFVSGVPGEPNEYGEIRGLSGRRLYLQKRWKQGAYGDYKSIKATDCVSHIWMSTEADAIKFALGKFLKVCDRHPEWEAETVNFCHDEIVFICKKGFGVTVAKALHDCMCEGMNQYITYIDPFKAHVGEDWTVH